MDFTADNEIAAHTDKRAEQEAVRLVLEAPIYKSLGARHWAPNDVDGLVTGRDGQLKLESNPFDRFYDGGVFIPSQRQIMPIEAFRTNCPDKFKSFENGSTGWYSHKLVQMERDYKTLKMRDDVWAVMYVCFHWEDGGDVPLGTAYRVLQIPRIGENFRFNCNPQQAMEYVEKEWGDSLTQDQRDCVLRQLSDLYEKKMQICDLTGGAGKGKTFTLPTIVRAFCYMRYGADERSWQTYAKVCSYTNTATERVAESLSNAGLGLAPATLLSGSGVGNQITCDGSDEDIDCAVSKFSEMRESGSSSDKLDMQKEVIRMLENKRFNVKADNIDSNYTIFIDEAQKVPPSWYKEIADKGAVIVRIGDRAQIGANIGHSEKNLDINKVGPYLFKTENRLKKTMRSDNNKIASVWDYVEQRVIDLEDEENKELLTDQFMEELGEKIREIGGNDVEIHYLDQTTNEVPSSVLNLQPVLSYWRTETPTRGSRGFRVEIINENVRMNKFENYSNSIVQGDRCLVKENFTFIGDMRVTKGSEFIIEKIHHTAPLPVNRKTGQCNFHGISTAYIAKEICPIWVDIRFCKGRLNGELVKGVPLDPRIIRNEHIETGIVGKRKSREMRSAIDRFSIRAEYAYCNTIDNAQGDEFECAPVIIGKRRSNELIVDFMRAFYTGITRSKKRVVICFVKEGK